MKRHELHFDSRFIPRCHSKKTDRLRPRSLPGRPGRHRPLSTRQSRASRPRARLAPARCTALSHADLGLHFFLFLVNSFIFLVKYIEPPKPHIRTYDDVVAADPKLGDRLIRQDAEKGNAQDQFYVGTWYILGHDVAKDPAEAAKWFRKSADQGYADAQVFLGQLYGSGTGVEKNLTEAIALFQKSAAQQNVRAYVCLGYSYEKGLGVPQDNKQAAEWYHKAKGDPRAEAGLKRLADVNSKL